MISRLLARRLVPLLVALLGVPATAVIAGCGSGEAEADAGPDPGARLAPLRLRRLLVRQYENSVRDLLGEEAAAAADPPADLSAHGFEAIGAADLSLSDAAVARYEHSARAVAEVVVRSPSALDRWMPCAPTGPTDTACLRSFLERFGRAAWRRPLDGEEVDRYLAVGAAAAAEYGSFQRGVEHVVAGLLQSPNFLYQVEVGEPDPENPDRRRLTGYELATRLSYFLLDTTPSEELLDLAEQGRLDDADGIREVAAAVLERPGAVRALEAFYEERFKLRELSSLAKDSSLFPEFDHDLAQSMRREALELFNHIVWETNEDYRELLTARYAFVNDELASLYGLAGPVGPDFVYRRLPLDEDRAGILGQAGFLAQNAHPAYTSPTRRGRFVTERLLCIEIPPPPPEVNAELPSDPGTPETMRQKLERHMEDPACSSCHVRMDPVGLALEGFDAVGRYRTNDRGLPLDLSGEVQGIGTFYGQVELGSLLASSDELHACWVRSLYRHATARLEFAGDRAVQDGLREAFAQSGYRVRDLLLELVASDGFRFAGHQPEGQ